ncbi:non-proton pumping type-II NADH dehydrogenase I [Besnoitia besnoiti]|uniref:NADH:ubiquinone reductase (non-electrogenic) n=1 Tax=Besnoitia besnoiti TaxID=94643 RepID=A0A2A9M7H5_BESBE|nr:non-proton pumping type-II NADH dehydrogenase I [Besnoitia besnoiti]PFH31846.1 non-proton pumping type-II NADH dehydrogenase I [Besnoitia besnoiti]
MPPSPVLRLLAGVAVPLVAPAPASPPARCDANQQPPAAPLSDGQAGPAGSRLREPPRPYSSLAPLWAWSSQKWTSLRLRTGLLSPAAVAPSSGASPGAPAGASGSSSGGGGRQRVVVVGSGWAAVSFLSRLDMTRYEPVVISPRDYFTFTPLLPSVCVGSLSAAACRTGVRGLLTRGGVACGRFFEARVEDIDPEKKTVRCRARFPAATGCAAPGRGDGGEGRTGAREHVWEQPYDYLVVTAGAEVNTFNVPGVKEHALFLKELEDARRIKARLFDVLEAASLPGLSEAERRKLLHFVVVGAGPTGVEVAAEIDDFFQSEGKKYFADLAPFVRITLVEMLPTVLAAYNAETQKFAHDLLEKNPRIHLRLRSQVVGVGPESVRIRSSTAGGPGAGAETEETELPCGLLVWASGIKSPKFCLDMTRRNEALRQAQKRTPVLLVDQQMKVRGCKDVYALGDCCRVKPPALLDAGEALYVAAVAATGKASSDWLEREAPRLSTIYPQLAPSKFDFSKKPRQAQMTREEFFKLLAEIDGAYRSPAPTAQNAQQGGYYLAQTFNAFPSAAEKERAPAFVETNRGALVYLGQGQAAAEIEGWRTFVGGLHTLLLWKAAYLQMQYSWLNVAACVGGWLKERLVGRDVAREHLDGEAVYSDRRK